MARFLVGLLLTLLLLLLTLTAHAEKRVLAVLEPSGTGSDAAARSLFRGAVEDALEAQGHGIAPRRSLALVLTERSDLEWCRNQTCLESWARLSGAQGAMAIFVDETKLHGAPGLANYVIHIEYFDASSTTLTRSPEEHCQRCGETELTRRLAALAGQLAVTTSQLPAPPATPPILAAPIPAAETHQPLRSRTMTWIGVAALATGAAAVGAGSALLAINGHGTCQLAAPEEVCPKIYNTVAGGAVLVALGGAALATGAALVIVNERARKNDLRTSLWLAPTIGGAVMAGTFR